MKTLCIAIGNTLRGDDGVAHRIVQRIERRDEMVVCGVLQLTPEIATEVARAETVIFIDADIDACEPSLLPVEAVPPRATPFTHSLSPREVVHMAERLYGFDGKAYVCHVPVQSFDGEELTDVAKGGARGALALLTAELQK
jgi:hydrogenase maturation protease